MLRVFQETVRGNFPSLSSRESAHRQSWLTSLFGDERSRPGKLICRPRRKTPQSVDVRPVYELFIRRPYWRSRVRVESSVFTRTMKIIARRIEPFGSMNKSLCLPVAFGAGSVARRIRQSSEVLGNYWTKIRWSGTGIIPVAFPSLAVKSLANQKVYYTFFKLPRPK